MSRRIEALLFIGILSTALALRVYDLRAVPPGAQHDEVFSANFAAQILNGARPVYFDQNGGVMALYAYLVAPAFAAFGHNILSLRLVSVACGLLTISLTYFTARQLFGIGGALISSALLSVSFWHLFESRVGLEPVALQMMALATAWISAKSQIRTPDPATQAPDAASGRPPSSRVARDALRGPGAVLLAPDAGSAGRGCGAHSARRGHNPAQASQSLNLGVGSMSPTRGSPVWRALRAAARSAATRDGVGDEELGVLLGLLLGLTTYTYHSAPLVLVSFAAFAGYLLIWQRAQFKARWASFAVMLVTALLVTAPLVIHVLVTPGDATSRTEDLSSDLLAILSGDVEPIARDIVGVLGMFAFTGDPSWRYNVPGRPVFGFVMGALAYIGFALALKRWREPRYAFVVIWIACNVLASAVTRSSPSFLRSSAALPFIVMLPGMAIGEWRIANCDFATRHSFDKLRTGLSHVTVVIILLLLAAEGVSTAHDYFTVWANAERVRSIYRADLAEIANFLDRQKPAGTVMLSARFPADLDQDALYLLQQKQQRYQWFNGRRVLVLPNDRSGQGVNYFIPASNESLFDGAALLRTLEARAGPLDEQGKPSFTLYYLPSDELNRLRARVPQLALNAKVANEMNLIGADVSVNAGNLHLLLYWRVTQRVRGDVNRTFFVHLLDANGRRWTQEDRPAHPTSSWQDDDMVWQWFDLKLPADAPAGDYWIDLGVYDANAPGQPRLPILGSEDKADHVRLGSFRF